MGKGKTAPQWEDVLEMGMMQLIRSVTFTLKGKEK